MSMTPRRIGGFLAAILVLALVYYQLQRSGALAVMMDSERLKVWIDSLGYGGPIALMGVMAAAIVINPIPSAPIALVAGALFGHTWGTIYAVTGATVGAMIAFGIARLLGYDTLSRFFGEKLKLGWLGSQNMLMGMVLVSRFVPFVSFDLVSYGAGLTPIRFWRFVIATVIGLIPASFLLAHFGGELSATDMNKALVIITVLGVITLVPIAIGLVYKKYRSKAPHET